MVSATGISAPPHWGQTLMLAELITSREFVSAVTGAIIGGLIAIGAQWLVISNERKKRDEDFKRQQQSLAGTLLYKMMRIHADYIGVTNYIEGCFTDAAKAGMEVNDPWRFVL